MGAAIRADNAMRYIADINEEAAEAWARSRLGLKEAPNLFKALSTVNPDGEFACVVLLTNFTKRNIDVNIAGEKGWATPRLCVDLFNGVFDTVFNKLKAVRATALIAESNVVSQKFVTHLGFQKEGKMRKAYDNDEDMFIYSLLKEEYVSHDWCRS
tara:strand:- start:647 stop:1114 length:468 start_codon:yes stop_codon:yes gene_type:complete